MNTLPTTHFQDGVLLNPSTLCTQVNLAEREVCLQEYIAVRLYEDSTQGWTYVVTVSFPVVVIVLVALLGVGLGKWLR